MLKKRKEGNKEFLMRKKERRLIHERFKEVQVFLMSRLFAGFPGFPKKGD